MSLQIGDKLQGRFEITRAISSGGMGSLFEAKDREQGSRRCAVKMMLSHLLDGNNAELFRTRFQGEIKLLEKLSHPGIPRYIASLENEMGFFLIMEFVQGRNLEQELEERMRLTGGPFPLDQALRDARQILDVLDHLHSFSPPLIHRDIKPANLIREHPSGRVKLVDFGLARSLDGGQAPQTQIGTLGYAAIEQLQGRAEVRSDLYSLGVSLHHLLTGEPPKPLDIPKLATLRPDLPADVAEWIDKATAPAAEQRFASAQQMLSVLNSLSAAQPKPQPPRPVASVVAAKIPDPLPVEVTRLAPAEPTRLMAVAAASSSAIRPSAPPLSAPSAADPTRLFEQAPLTSLIDDEIALPPPPTPQPAEAELPPPLSSASPSRQMPALKHAWIGLLGLGVVAAFWAGRHTARQPLAPSPTPTPVAEAPSPAQATATPGPPVVLASETPLPSPTPLVVHNRRSFLKQQEANKKPKTPVTNPEPGEAPQHYSLNGPNYPVRSGPANPAPVKKPPPRPLHQPAPYSAPADSYDPSINLPDGWNKVASSRGSLERLVAFQKPGPSPVRFTVRTYITQQPKNRIHQSFNALRTGWSPRGDLPAVDEAMERNAHGTHEIEALVTRPGRYYLLRLECHGGTLPPEQFQKEVLEALGGLEIP